MSSPEALGQSQSGPHAVLALQTPGGKTRGRRHRGTVTRQRALGRVALTRGLAGTTGASTRETVELSAGTEIRCPRLCGLADEAQERTGRNTIFWRLLIPPQWNKRWREKNPEKVRCHSAVQTALRNGTLQRQPCVSCGATNTHAHHEDYTEPLIVLWLCPLCHKKAHKKGRHVTEPRTYKSKPRPLKPRHLWKSNLRKYAHLEIARAARAKGASYGEIAKLVGATRGTVYKWLNNVSYN
jgi:Homeodomain-like domain